MSKRKISRRQFLGEASCSAVGSMAFLSSVLNLGAINTLAARPHILANTETIRQWYVYYWLVVVIHIIC